MLPWRSPRSPALALITHGIGATRHRSELDPQGLLLAALSTLPLAVWRRAPLSIYALTAAAGVLASYLEYGHGIPVGATAALYFLAASRSVDKPWRREMTAVVVALFALYLVAAGLAGGALPVIEFFVTGLAWAVAWFAGERTRLVREHMIELRERAVAAEKAAETERRLAVAEERARIARDLHDAAGHAINVIAVRAGAARLSHRTHPERALAALQDIEEVARQAAGEVDGMVHSLRDDRAGEADTAAPVGLASLSTIVDHHRRSGLKVAVRRCGDERPLSRAADQSAYRILQEALTNAARHGRGEVQVELAFGDAALQVTVENPAPGDRNGSGRGHGLTGMRERAALAGGSLEAGPTEGGFRVRAWIPYEARHQ